MERSNGVKRSDFSCQPPAGLVRFHRRGPGAAAIAAVTVVMLTACYVPVGFGDDAGSDEHDSSGIPAVQTVLFSLAAGTYREDIHVEMWTETAGATIHYSTDSSEPDADSNVYTEPIEISGHGSEMTIKAIAVADGFAASQVAEAHYVIDYDTAAMPVFEPGGGIYTRA